MDAKKGQSQRNIALALAIGAIVVAGVLYFAGRDVPAGTVAMLGRDADSSPAASAAEAASETFRGQLQGTSDSTIHEFTALMADGTLAIECEFNQQGVNPSVAFTIATREGDGDWSEGPQSACRGGATRAIAGPSSARVRVLVDGGICACDYTVTLSYQPARAR